MSLKIVGRDGMSLKIVEQSWKTKTPQERKITSQYPWSTWMPNSSIKY